MRSAVTAQKATIHQATTMLSTAKNIVFLGHNHLLTTGADGPTLVFDYCPSATGNSTFLEVDSMVVTWWIVAFFGQ